MDKSAEFLFPEARADGKDLAIEVHCGRLETISDIAADYFYPRRKAETRSPVSVQLRIDGETTAEIDAPNFDEAQKIIAYVRLWLAAEIPNILDKKAA